MAHSSKKKQDFIKHKSLKENSNQMRTKNLEAGKIDAYIEEIKKAKDKRIFEILRETDNFLKEIGSRILSLKKQGNAEMGMEMEEDNNEWLKKIENVEDFDIKNSTLDADNYKKFYYSLTHSNTEEIK